MDDILAPRAEISENSIKFGDVNSDALPISATLTITNRGEAPLVIRDIRCGSPEVGCTLKAGTTVEPGATLATEVILMPKRGMSEGALSEQVAIVTDDPITPYQVIRVTATYKQIGQNKY